MFWFSVLVGAVFAMIGIKKGFYPIWAILFNILISIYLGIMLAPTIVGIIPDIGGSRYHYAGCVAGIAIVVFAVFQTIATSLLTGTCTVSFPKIFSNVGAGILGFLSGYLVCSFALFVICITPFSKEPFMRSICGRDDLAPSAVASVVKVCDFVGALSLQRYDNVAAGVVDWLIMPADESGGNPDETERTDHGQGSSVGNSGKS